MLATAVVIDQPEHLTLRRLALNAPGEADVVVDVEWTGISTGTERLLYGGRMPPFPGLGYPLVPGYETVGRVVEAGPQSGRRVGERVFVAGAKCFAGARGLFGGAAERLVVPGGKALPLAGSVGQEGVLLALAATAYHAAWGSGGATPDLIVGHGALGRLLARLVAQLDPTHRLTVWEAAAARRQGAHGYRVIDPALDERRDYHTIIDMSGDAGLIDALVARLAPGGELVLAGFYHHPVHFDFVPAFLREARLRIAAEWKPADLAKVTEMVNSGALPLDGIITHRLEAEQASQAYRTAFGDPTCVKMILDWSHLA